MKSKKNLILALLLATSLLPVDVALAADFSKVDLHAHVRLWYTRYSVGLPPIGAHRDTEWLNTPL